MRRSPFMEVRFISPAWAAGNIRWAPAAESQSIELLLGVTAVVERPAWSCGSCGVDDRPLKGSNRVQGRRLGVVNCSITSEDRKP